MQYHIVWVTKYRKPIFMGVIEQDVKNYLVETLKSLDMVPIAMEVTPDHIHLLVEATASPLEKPKRPAHGNG